MGKIKIQKQKICDWCEIELIYDEHEEVWEYIETINDEILCYGCDCKRLSSEQ